MKIIDELIERTSVKANMPLELVKKVVYNFFNSIKNEIDNNSAKFYWLPRFGKLYFKGYKKPDKRKEK